MATTYFATRLSESIGETPDGFRVCTDTVLARTGWQTYSISELISNFSAERLAELGVDTRNPYATIDLYRRAEEVFAPQTLSSAEGKPFTDGHPPEFVDPDNFRKYARGHIANVRKGKEALESGDWPLEGDIIINDAELIRKVDAGLREISLGYAYDLVRDGDTLLQVDFVINHAAAVPKARAGSEARINDSAESVAEVIEVNPAAQPTEDSTIRLVEAAAWSDQKTSAAKAADTNSKKERNVKNTLFGRILKALALDTETTPEEFAEVSKVVSRAMDGEESEEEKKKAEKAEDEKRANDKRASDEAEAKEKKEREEKEAIDKRAKDAACKPGEEGHMKCTGDKCMAGDRGANDADGGDHRKRMHDALDSMLDKHEEKHGPLEGQDADMGELKDLMAQFLSEEAMEPEHAGDAETSGMLEPVGEMAGETANDAAAALLPVIEKSREKKVLMKAFDAAPLDSEFEFLKAIKPDIAKSKDPAVRRAYDAQVKKYTRTSRVAQGGYAAFAGAAQGRDSARINNASRAVGSGPGQRDYSKLQKIYDDAVSGKNPQANA